MSENMKKTLYVLVGILSIGIIVLILLKTNGNDTKTYTITFNTDGGSEVVSQKIEAGSLVKKPDDPTKEGFTFEGWLYENELYNFNATVNKDISLIAKWNEISEPEKFVVTFDTDGGSNIENIEVSKDESITMPDNPTKEGFTFKYWTLNGNEYDFASKVTENITLKAVWEQNEPSKTGYYQVSFDTKGGSSIETKEVKSGSTVSKPSNPTRTGYVFLDWYLNGKIYNFSSKITTNITLVAEWAREGTYQITFDTDGGSSVANQIVNAGKLVTKPANPTKENMMFAGWQLNGVNYNFNTKVTKDMTLKAVWKTPEYTVSFNTDGGSSVKSQTVKINNKATKPNDPTKTGHTFDGWYVGDTEFDFSSPITANVTIKAKWKAIEYTITFDTDGGSNVPEQKVSYGSTVTKPANPTKDTYTFASWQLNNTDYNFNTKVTGNITLKAKWTKETTSKTYTFKVVKVDNQSTDRRIYIYENGNQITVSKIKYTDGLDLCQGSSPTVMWNDIEGVTSLKVVLLDKSTVTATLSN